LIEYLTNPLADLQTPHALQPRCGINCGGHRGRPALTDLAADDPMNADRFEVRA
jgi:hypothetical protein